MRKTQNPPWRPNETDLVVRWGVAALIIVGLLTFGHWVIYYAASVDDVRARLGTSLPANYRDTIRTMIQASAGTCRQVCDVTVAGLAARKGTFRIICGVAPEPDACKVTRSYTMTIEQTGVPSR